MNTKIAMVLALVGIMTLFLVVTKPLANQAFAQIPCDLTLKANPGSVAPAPAKGQPEDLTGKLICGGAGYSGADIHLSVVPSASGEWAVDENTDSSGNFEYTQHSGPGPGLVVYTPQSYHITTKYAGDPDHMDGEHQAATASITITTTIEHHKTGHPSTSK